MIKTEGLTKVFRIGFWGKKVTALQGLDLEIEEGEVFGFLGPNGAGKTTTLKILMGLLYPTSGRAWIMDKPISDVNVKRQIGFLPEAPYFYEYLTATEFLHFYGQLFGIAWRERKKKIDALLDVVGLAEARRLQLRKFSKGMLQRIGIAQALINDPKLVILDEPMSGLDPIGRKEMRDLILRLRDEGRTIFFSTHILPDVEMTCDRVGILVKGKLIQVGVVAEALNSLKVKSVEITAEGLNSEVLDKIKASGGTVRTLGNRHFIQLPAYRPGSEGEDPPVDILQIIKNNNGRIISLIPQKESLEDFFFRQVKGETKAMSNEQ